MSASHLVTDPSGLTQMDIVGPNTSIPGSEVVLFRAGLLLILLSCLVVPFVLMRRRWRRNRGMPRRRPVGLIAVGTVLCLGALSAFANRPPRFFVPEFPPLPRLLDEDSFYYRRVDSLPVLDRSESVMASVGEEYLRPGASSQVLEGVVWGMPFNLVDSTTPTHEFLFLSEGSSDPGRYPVPDRAYVQSMPTYGIDDHYIAVDLEGRTMWEVFMIRNWFGRWSGTTGARWDLDELTFPKGKTTASGLPILPGVFTWAEVDSGRIDHVLRMSCPVVAAGDFVWPARSTDGRSKDPAAPPMGSWLRLRADADLTPLGPQATVVARALQQYGAVVSDTGGRLGLAGTPDARWDDRDLGTLANLSARDFEVVDASSLMLSPESMEARDPGA